MAKKAKAKPRPFREIPNRQVMDVAEQFHNAYQLLINQGPFTGVLLPALHCAFIGMELYLKALSALEVEVPAGLIPGGVSIIHAESPHTHHNLDKLFDDAPPDAQAAMEIALKSSAHLLRFASVREALGGYNSMFMATRYLFEPNSDLSTIVIEEVTELLDVLKAGASTIPMRYERLP